MISANAFEALKFVHPNYLQFESLWTKLNAHASKSAASKSPTSKWNFEKFQLEIFKSFTQSLEQRSKLKVEIRKSNLETSIWKV